MEVSMVASSSISGSGRQHQRQAATGLNNKEREAALIWAGYQVKL